MVNHMKNSFGHRPPTTDCQAYPQHLATIVMQQCSSLYCTALFRMTPAALRTNLVEFLTALLPQAEESGLLLALHPDDPPRSILGLPNIASTGQHRLLCQRTELL